jgi:hypothetical protein
MEWVAEEVFRPLELHKEGERMAKLSNRMVQYEAPDGYVYDWAEPKEDNHLYVKYLFLSKNDKIENYTLVKDPRGN